LLNPLENELGLEGAVMKAKKALKRLAKIEVWMSDVTERYSTSAPNIREVLQKAKTAVTRAKKALSLQASSGTAKKAPLQKSKPTPKATPQPSKPKRKPSAAGRKVTKKATAKKAAVKKATVVKAAKAPTPKAAKKAPVKKVARKKVVEEAVLVVHEAGVPAAPSTEITESTTPPGTALGNE
jgi:DNA-binding protein HU-beta